jgi:hypothetical protein
MLDLHATTWALKSAPSINEENLQAPQGNELEATWSKGIVAWGGPNADGTERFAVFSSSHVDLDTFADETYRLVNETPMFLNTIQYSLELHPVAVSLKDGVLFSSFIFSELATGCACFFGLSAVSVDPFRGETMQVR